MRSARDFSRLLALALLTATAAFAEDPLRQFDIPLPGRHLASAADAPWGGHGVVVLLRDELEEEDDEAEERAPRRIVVVDLGGTDPTLSPLAVALPSGADDLALIDVDGDGAEELLVSAEGAIYSLGRAHRGEPVTAPRVIWEGPGATVSAVRILPGQRPSPGLAVARAGTLELWAAQGDSTPTLRAVHRLPVSAELHRWGLLLDSPPITDLGGGRFAIGPAEHGSRLATELIGFAEEGATSWSRLPGEEVYQNAEVDRVDDQLVLVVTTLEERGVFEKLQLRLFPLAAGGGSIARSPSFAVATDANSWYTAKGVFRDLDGDGKDDLIVLHPEGMGGGDLEMAAYRGRGGGRFEPRGKHSKRKLDDGFYDYGHDLTADGLPDLVIQSGSRLAVYTAVAGRSAFKVVSKKPTWQLDLDSRRGKRQVTISLGGDGAAADIQDIRRGRLEVLDVDGDELAEILLWGRTEEHDHLTVILHDSRRR